MDISYGVIEDVGWRDSMEDEHAIYRVPERAFFSAEIYDGHGGKKAAQIAAEALTPYFLHAWAKETEKSPKYRYREYEILRDAYLAIDNQIVETGVGSGTTAATLYIVDERFIASNVGDTRVIIGTKQGVSLLTVDHKPNLPPERSRIERLGGWVSTHGVSRVQGILAVSRALGDVRLKPYVSSEPRIVEGCLAKENDYAVLACDGVWDVLSPDRVIEIARTEKDPRIGASKIRDEALNHGSTDNISVIVIGFGLYTQRVKRAAMEITTVVDYAS